MFTDPVADLAMDDVRRGDLIALRERVRQQTGPNATNKVMTALRTVFREALYREDIDRDPSAGINAIKYERRVPDVFTRDDLTGLFPIDGLGPWRDTRDFTCFLVAATTGMRRGEILALRWEHLDLGELTLRVEAAWQGEELGPPKRNSRRTVPLPQRTAGALSALRDASASAADDDLVFCYDDGRRLGGTWWTKRFAGALARSGIDRGERTLTAHSFRHTVATMLADGGADPEKIRASLGWTTRQIQDVYTHWDVTDRRDQARIIDDIWVDSLTY